jgi:hypothetical protein
MRSSLCHIFDSHNCVLSVPSPDLSVSLPTPDLTVSSPSVVEVAHTSRHNTARPRRLSQGDADIDSSSGAACAAPGLAALSAVKRSEETCELKTIARCAARRHEMSQMAKEKN